MFENIVLTRVDNRLVHGQVGITWCTTLGVEHILVVDKATHTDTFQQMLMKTVASAGHSKIVFSCVETFFEDYEKIKSSHRIMIVVKNLDVCVALIKMGVTLNEINLGNIHYEKGKKQYWKKIYLNDEDVDHIRYLLSKKIRIFVQDVPGCAIEKVTYL